jgi:DNA modification methylase
MKLCAWYGNLDSFNIDGSHYGEPSESKTVSNSRGSYDFKADPRGKHLSDVFQQPITKLHSESDHSHSKPVDWIRMLIADCTDGDVYDPFSGSGTTIIACEQLKRKCRAIEISPGYVAVAIQRWADATGKEPKRLA